MFLKKIKLNPIPILIKIKNNFKKFKTSQEIIIKKNLKENQEKLELIPQKLLFNSSYYINEKTKIIKKITNIKINVYSYIFSLLTLGIVTLYYIKI
jgi:hypothetical protein